MHIANVEPPLGFMRGGDELGCVRGASILDSPDFRLTAEGFLSSMSTNVTSSSIYHEWFRVIR